MHFAAKGQDFTWKNYTIRDGLPHSTVYRIFQDNKKLLWLSTDFGLSSFDGHTFRSDFNDPEGLLNSTLLSVSERADGAKLICTVNDLVLFTDSSVSRLKIPGGKVPKDFIYAQEWKGRTWIIAYYPGTSRPRLYELNTRGLILHDIRDNAGNPVEFNTLVNCKDELIFSSSNGLFSVRDTMVHRLPVEVPGREVVDAVKDSRGGYWAGYRDGVVVFKDGKAVFTVSLPDRQHVNDIYLDRDDHLWIATEEGGLLKVAEGKALVIPGLRSLGPVIINDIFQDFEGNIWLATYGSGLYMLNSVNVLDYTAGENIPSIYSRTISPVNDQIWISSIGKVFSLKHGRIENLAIRRLGSEYYTYFVKQVADKVYIGSSYGLVVKDLKPPFSERLLTPAVISICCDSKHRVWFGSYKGVFTLSDDTLKAYPVSPLIDNRRINAMTEDHQGNIWCGIGAGAFVFDPGHRRRPFQVLPRLQIVMDIKEDSAHRIWLASTNGLGCIDGERQRVFTKSDGLASNSVSSLLFAKGVLWVGTAGGLNLVYPEDMRVKNLTPVLFRDVILSLHRQRDLLFVGTTNSVYSVDMNDPLRDDTPPPLFITQVRTGGKRLNWPLRVGLPYRENGLQISFIGISYQASHLVEYRYRISNLDEKWRYTTNNLIEIPSLPSGSYTFILNGRKNNGPWSRDITLAIDVETPFWKTWWFLTLMVVALAGSLFVLTRAHTRGTERRKRRNLEGYNKMAYLKQQALSALINPHFIFNCMNSIQHFLNSHDNEKANEYLADFAQLIRMTLEDAQETFLSLDKEVSRIRLYLSLEQLRFGDRLEYEINIPSDLDARQLRIPNMILQPYVENAIWHGIMPRDGAGKISLRFGLSKDQLTIVVEDDGVGIAEDPLLTTTGKKTHYGIRLTRQRLQLLRELSAQYYDITISNLSDTPGRTGTRVEILVPAAPHEDVLERIEDDMDLDTPWIR